MIFNFFQEKNETPASLRRKAEELLARSIDQSGETSGSFQTGENRLKRAGTEGDFRQFRNYREGDRPQDIDWKRSARSDDTLIREREKNQQRILDLYIQNYQGMYFSSSSSLPTKYDIAARLGLALGLWASGNHDPVRYWGEKINIDDLPSLLLESKNPPFHEWNKNSITVLIGDYTDTIEHLEPVLAGLSANTVLLLQILDPAEMELPYNGRHIFDDGTDRITVNNTDSIREDYQSALDKHLKSLQNYCRKRTWHYELIRTDGDLIKPFNRALAAIGDRR